jgi:Cytochrome P450
MTDCNSLTSPEKGSLVSRLPAAARYQPSSQIAQWLFAFDPAGMTTFRTLALLACHRQFMDRARKEALKNQAPADARQSFIRRCVPESLRLWPTTPAILREAVEDISWNDCRIARGTGVIIFTPFFGRDDEKLNFAHKMSPDIWERSQNDALVPLGPHPVQQWSLICPAHNLVPLLACLVIEAVLAERELSLIAPRLDPQRCQVHCITSKYVSLRQSWVTVPLFGPEIRRGAGLLCQPWLVGLLIECPRRQFARRLLGASWTYQPCCSSQRHARVNFRIRDHAGPSADA